MSITKATYTTEFQDGTTVSSSCNYNRSTGQITDIEVVNAEVDASVAREYVTLPSGEVIEISGDGETSE
jgi:hypothetical protein